MTSEINETLPACVARTDLYLHPFLAESESPSNSAERREREMLRLQANALCESCPSWRNASPLPSPASTSRDSWRAPLVGSAKKYAPG